MLWCSKYLNRLYTVGIVVTSHPYRSPGRLKPQLPVNACPDCVPPWIERFDNSWVFIKHWGVLCDKNRGPQTLAEKDRINKWQQTEALIAGDALTRCNRSTVSLQSHLSDCLPVTLLFVSQQCVRMCPRVTASVYVRARSSSAVCYSMTHSCK